MVWDLEADVKGVVISGRNASIQGQLHENGTLIPGYEQPHTFTFDIEQIRQLMYEENLTASEAVESILVRYVRDLQRSSDPGAGDNLPSPPMNIPGFNNKAVRGEPKAHRDGEVPPPAPSPPPPPPPPEPTPEPPA